MARRFETVSFLSDLGTADETTGVVRAVLRDMAPHTVVVDLTHGIPPYDVRAGSLALARAIGYVPPGVIIAAVDAGPANGRSHVAIEVADGVYLFQSAPWALGNEGNSVVIVGDGAFQASGLLGSTNSIPSTIRSRVSSFELFSRALSDPCPRRSPLNPWQLWCRPTL